ncbi:putative aminopeptidase YsdC [Clostridium tepidiprofundi DSM 19306]|uniref:Putative aminopeptidase YsdC n=1 Tax=Clostridium tepidiprofundi DSM 19306 TaxID=1121338 RepID=A0A151AVI5_9CLOT|nr:M42 family metallopeptidase [Clostridium tepidiprofundi]KYH31573.1 putative aminopeptidase YsdC [Clostridium tepidiprofundi DSM 19306]
MNEKSLLKNLCMGHAPSGRENWIFPLIKEAFEPYCDEVRQGNLNNVYAIKKGNGKESIMIMAHSDEVFLMVTEICKNGFIKFDATGIDPKTLISQEVCIHGRKKIDGIIGIKPPHIMNEDDRKSAVKIKDLMIDTGISEENIKHIVSVGDFVTLKREFYELLNNNVTCKATDDRAGIVAMWSCAKELKNINNDLDVYFVASCQEEVGHRGAKMASYDLNPTLAIAIDVTFDGGKMGDEDRETKLGGGPVICIGPNIHPKFREKIMKIAEEYNIAYQIEVEPGSTGTDAWDIQISRKSVPTLLISIPQKYMHTSVEIVNMDDIKNTGRLIAKFIEKVNSCEVEELLCF